MNGHTIIKSEKIDFATKFKYHTEMLGTATDFKKPLIFCIVGESGSGKTMLANYLNELADIPMIKSWTDRPKRSKSEKGHTFVTKEQFDKFRKKDMIAFTKWEGYRYCCFHSDVRAINTYVIDEHGLQYLKNNFSDRYKIISIRIHRHKSLREKFVSKSRMERDEGKFYLPGTYYDIIIHNNSMLKINLILDVWNEIKIYI